MLASFAAVTASSAILAVVTFASTIEAVTTALLASLAAVTALSAILAVVTAPLVSLAAVTVLSLGVPILTEDPTVIMKKSAPLAGAELNIISAPSRANPSLG